MVRRQVVRVGSFRYVVLFFGSLVRISFAFAPRLPVSGSFEDVEQVMAGERVFVVSLATSWPELMQFVSPNEDAHHIDRSLSANAVAG